MGEAIEVGNLPDLLNSSFTIGLGVVLIEYILQSGFLIKILAWIKLAQAKLWVSQCICHCSNHVYNRNFIVFLSAIIQHCMNNIGPSHFTAVLMWPKRHRTLSKTLIAICTAT